MSHAVKRMEIVLLPYLYAFVQWPVFFGVFPFSQDNLYSAILSPEAEGKVGTGKIGPSGALPTLAPRFTQIIINANPFKSHIGGYIIWKSLVLVKT